MFGLVLIRVWVYFSSFLSLVVVGAKVGLIAENTPSRKFMMTQTTILAAAMNKIMEALASASGMEAIMGVAFR